MFLPIALLGDLKKNKNAFGRLFKKLNGSAGVDFGGGSGVEGPPGPP